MELSLQLLGLGLGLESAVDGKAFIDNELVYYAKVKNFPKFLAYLAANAEAIEHQTQHEHALASTLEGASANKARCRIRRSIMLPKNTVYDHQRFNPHTQGAQYVQEYKVRGARVAQGNRIKGNVSIPNPSSRDTFEALWDYCAGGQMKVRYTIPSGVDNTKFEYDIYLTKDGMYEWVKVDLEYQQALSSQPTLPDYFDQVILNQWGKRTDAEIAQIDKILGDVRLMPGDDWNK